MAIFNRSWRLAVSLGAALQAGALGLSSLAQADLGTVAPPCVDTNNPAQAKAAGSAQAGARTCKEMLEGGADKAKDPGFMAAFDKQISDYAENYYNHCDLDLSAKPDNVTLSNGAKCQGTEVPGATCNVLQQPGIPPTFNKGVESTTDHLGHSCGQWPFFKAQLTGKKECTITPVYTHVSSDRYIEEAYNRGAFIQALNCFHQQVRNEIAARKLRITDPGNKGMLAKLQKTYQEAIATSQKMKSAFGAEANLSDVENCTGNEVGSGKDVGRLRQSACQLNASRIAQESMFMNLAAAEVFARARKSHEQFLARSPSQGMVDKTLSASVNEALVEFQGFKGSRDLCNSQAALEKFVPKYLNIIKHKASAIWNSQTCR